MTSSKETAGVDAEALRARLFEVRERIEGALQRSKAGQDVKLVAVSKTHPVEAMEVLYEEGVRAFGESYVQEWEEKAARLPGDVEWHFVGRLQSNKARFVTDQVALVHSVDRKSLIRALDRRSEKPVDVLLQVNLGLQDTKGGVSFSELEALMEKTTKHPSLRVRGLMGMPPYAENPEESRPHFARLRTALEALRTDWDVKDPERGRHLRELSMGMSNDFEVAIEEGATIVRLGTVLFGERNDDD